VGTHAVGEQQQSKWVRVRKTCCEHNAPGIHLEAYVRQLQAADFDRLIDINPRRPVAYNGRGSVLLELNQLDRALQDFDKAIELNPKEIAPYNNRGVVFERKGDTERAIAEYRRALELAPLHPGVIANLKRLASAPPQH